MKRIYAEKFKRVVSDYFFLTFKEFVLAIILTFFFIFLSFVFHTRTEPGADVGSIYVYFGFPMEWFRIVAMLESWYATYTCVEILWSGLAINIILFFLLSVVVVRVTDKIADIARAYA